MISRYKIYGIALLALASTVACSDFCPERIYNMALISREGNCTAFDDDMLEILVRRVYLEEDLCAPVRRVERTTTEGQCNVTIRLSGEWEDDPYGSTYDLYGFARFEITNCPDACSEIIEFALGAGPMAFD